MSFSIYCGGCGVGTACVTLLNRYVSKTLSLVLRKFLVTSLRKVALTRSQRRLPKNCLQAPLTDIGHTGMIVG
ncbi:MAG: hypothetical protein ACI8PT_000994 [Gammaproteobacteria bacterium]|jgi:hypothetical protein